jgi:DNA polymerase III delta prime subunit
LFASALTDSPFGIDSINGRNVDSNRIREWQDRGHYVSRSFSVKIINEVDTLPAQAQDLALTWLDELSPFNAVIATSNLNLSELSPRFQSRFQQFHVKAPAASDIAPLLKTFGINGHSELLAGKCAGNVRAALLDAQSILDAA